MSSVFRALDRLRGDGVVAVKLLNSEHPDVIRREFFRRETVALQRLDHPHIVKILDSGWSDADGCFFIVLEHLGRSLLDELHAHAGSDASWCWPIIRKVADALVFAHSEGVIHRDIKPSNILFAAAGEPKLTDFGTSRLKYELAAGMTVGAFWSPGYASPEQRRGDAGDETSDVYSLGAVLFHLLSGTAPPADEPLAPLVNALSVHQHVKRTLASMLATSSDERLGDMTQVRRAFEAVDQATAEVPQLLLIMTEPLRRDLFDLGLIPSPSWERAAQVLLDELGGDELLPVDCLLRQDTQEVSILGRTIRLSCRQHRSRRALVATSAQIPYAPTLELQRASAASIRLDWQPVVEAELTRLTQAEHATFERNVASLLEQLTTHERRARVGAARREERRSFLDVWGRIIRFQEQRVMERATPLGYQRVATDGDVLEFQLEAPIPDDLPWEEGAALAARDLEHRKPAVPVGTLVAAQGSRVLVDAHGRRQPDRRQPRHQLPSPGFLILFQPEEQAVLRRQKSALITLRSGTAENPHLAEILMDVSRAEFDVGGDERQFFQATLDADKRHAVTQALKAKDLFLLQGPPGTGKTSAIAELVLQILAEDSRARILVSSQSNVAVDHVLERLGQLVTESGVELLRVGRAENLGQLARAFGMEQRLASWRATVLERCRSVLEELSAPDAGPPSSNGETLEQDGLDDLRQCLRWIDEATAWRETLRENEEWQAAITDARSVMAVSLGPEAQAILTETAAARERIGQHLATVRSFLPAAVGEGVKSDLDQEIDHLRGVVATMLKEAGSNDPQARTRALVQQWCDVAGLTPDFETLILDRANVLGATCSYAGAQVLHDSKFDWVIVDEAGRATAAEALIPLVRGRTAVLVGDERQLPPMLDEELSPAWLAAEGIEPEDLERSLFEQLVEQAAEANPQALRRLSTQHRMHPAIGELISQVFYDGVLLHGTDETSRDHKIAWLPRPVIWLTTSDRPDRYENGRGHSYENRLEAEAVPELLSRIERSYRQGDITREVGVLSGYSAQIEALRTGIQPDDCARWRALGVEVATVDAFQGRDRDIVIYSATRSNRNGRIGFMRDRRRLNVALSRARELLIVVGDHEMLARATVQGTDNPFAQVIQHVLSRPDSCMILSISDVIGTISG